MKQEKQYSAASEVFCNAALSGLLPLRLGGFGFPSIHQYLRGNTVNVIISSVWFFLIQFQCLATRGQQAISTAVSMALNSPVF